MSKTPGFILPSSYSSQKELKDDLERRDKEAGHTPFNPEDFIHSSMSPEEFIEHYGKKGMKWGVRKARTQVKVSSDYKNTAAYRNKHPAELSNKQLQKVNARIALEKNYAKNLPPSKIKKHLTTGQKAVATIIATAGTAAAVYNLQNNPAIKALMASGAKSAAKFAASKASKVPYEQLKLF